MSDMAVVRAGDTRETDEFINPGLSIYLDFFRFFMAALVVIFHVREGELFLGDALIAHFGQEAVIAFFVLSGLVISKTARRANATGARFAIDRMTRLYSVAVPAVLFTLLVAWIMHTLQPGAPSRIGSVFDVVSSLLFLNESWGNPADLRANTPYWSLCYEAWFYVLFACWAFARGAKRYFLLILSALVAGPQILLLMPAWLLGVALDRYPPRVRLGPVAGLLLALLPLLLVVACVEGDLRQSLRDAVREAVPPLWWFRRSQDFVYDFGIALLFAVHFIGMRALLMSGGEALASIAPLVRRLGDTTFSIYLFHFPMVLLAGAAGVSAGTSLVLFLALCVAIIAICMAFALVTEARRKAWEPLAAAVVSLGRPSSATG